MVIISKLLIFYEGINIKISGIFNRVVAYLSFVIIIINRFHIDLLSRPKNTDIF